MTPIEEDKFGTPLKEGDQIIICYDKNGYLLRATITGQKGDQWVIRIDPSWVGGKGYEKRIDKNPRRMVKYG